jgi:hypothetical protein
MVEAAQGSTLGVRVYYRCSGFFFWSFLLFPQWQLPPIYAGARDKTGWCSTSSSKQYRSQGFTLDCPRKFAGNIHLSSPKPEGKQTIGCGVLNTASFNRREDCTYRKKQSRVRLPASECRFEVFFCAKSLFIVLGWNTTLLWIHGQMYYSLCICTLHVYFTLQEQVVLMEP